MMARCIAGLILLPLLVRLTVCHPTRVMPEETDVGGDECTSCFLQTDIAPCLSETEISKQPPTGTILNPLCLVNGAALSVVLVASLLDDLVNVVRSALRTLPGLLDLVAEPLAVVARDALGVTKDVIACWGHPRDSHQERGVAHCILDALRAGYSKIKQHMPPLKFALEQLVIGAFAAPLLDLVITLGNALNGLLDLLRYVLHCLATRNFLVACLD